MSVAGIWQVLYNVSPVLNHECGFQFENSMDIYIIFHFTTYNTSQLLGWWHWRFTFTCHCATLHGVNKSRRWHIWYFVKLFSHYCTLIKLCLTWCIISRIDERNYWSLLSPFQNKYPSICQTLIQNSFNRQNLYKQWRSFK